MSRIAGLCPRRIYAAHFGFWEPALPYIHVAAGQSTLIWDTCRDIFVQGGTLPDLRQRVAEMLAGTRLATRGQAELEKNFFAMAESVWNYVATETRT